MTEESYIFLAGGSRGVGREIAKCLVEKNQKVKAMLRTEASRSELEALGVKIAIADAFDPAAVEQAMAGEPIDAVITTIGGVPQEGQRPDYLGNKNLIDAAVKAGVKKFILVTSIGTGNSVGALSPQALETLREVLLEKEKAEQDLIASGMIYTIIRPGGLKSEQSTGNGVLTADTTVAGMIHRADVAKLVCSCLFSDAANNQVLSAIDRNMLFGAPEFEEFKLS